jgi:hypothetical protein
MHVKLRNLMVQATMLLPSKYPLNTTISLLSLLINHLLGTITASGDTSIRASAVRQNGKNGGLERLGGIAQLGEN